MKPMVAPKIVDDHYTKPLSSENVLAKVSEILSSIEHAVAYLTRPPYNHKAYGAPHYIMLFVGFDGISEKAKEEEMDKITEKMWNVFGLGIGVYEEQDLPTEPDIDDRLLCLRKRERNIT